MIEMTDIYDSDRKFTGLQLPRKTKLPEGQYMLYVLALVRDSENRFLITRRSLTKKWAAGHWEIPGGGASAGETSLQAVIREVREEDGLDISESSPKVIYSYRNDDPDGDNYFVDMYLCDLDFSLEDVKIQEEEVIDVKLATLEEIRLLHETDGFMHYRRVCEALEEMK